MSDDADALAEEDLVEYCRTQAGLLSGRVETLGEAADELLEGIDEDIAEIRTRLSARESGGRASAASPSTPGGTESDGEIAELEELEAELGEKQAMAEDTQARMAAVQSLAAGYIELADDIASSGGDGTEALDRVVRFERDNDAPAYFDDLQTVLEAVAGSDQSSAK